MTSAAVSAAVMATGCILSDAAGEPGTSSIGDWVAGLAIIMGGSLGIGAAGHWLASSHHHRHGVFRRIFLAISALLAAWFCLLVSLIGTWISGGEANNLLIKSAMTTPFVSLLVLDWRALFSPIRRSRLAIMPAISAAGIAALLAVWFDADPVVAASVAAGLALTVQVMAPFAPLTEQEILERQRAREEIAKRQVKPSVPQRKPQPKPKSRPLASDASPQPVQAQLAGALEAAPSGVSTRSRSITLILCAVPLIVPAFGMQRFYAGKIGTGILYLLTFGVCGIGQLVDAIIIAMGQFTDGEGRMIVSWPGYVLSGPSMSTPVNSWSSVPVRRPLGPSIASLLGLLLIAVGCLLALAINAPPAIVELETYGVLESSIHSEMTRALGAENWPAFLLRPAVVLIAMIFVVGIAMLLLGRRYCGAAHMVRGVLGTAICIGALSLVNVVCQKTDWNHVAVLMAEKRAAAAINSVIAADEHMFGLIASCVGLLAGFIVLSWPPAPPKLQTAPTRPEEQEIVS
jgi:hypothetical protein